MTTQRLEVAVLDDREDVTKTAAGTLTAGHIVRVEYDDTAELVDLEEAMRKAADRIIQTAS